MLTWFQRAEDLVVGKHGRDGIETAGQSFAEQRHIRLDALVLFRKQLAGAAEYSLDLVEDQHHVVRSAELAHPREIACRWNDDAGFALDGFDQEGDGVRRDGVFQRGKIAEANDFEARRE